MSRLDDHDRAGARRAAIRFSGILLAGGLAGLMPAACAMSQTPVPPAGAGGGAVGPSAPGPSDPDRVTLTGVLQNRGNGVMCPQLRRDDGTMQSISGLPSDIRPGMRVRVSGRIGHSPVCLGPVLMIDAFERL